MLIRAVEAADRAWVDAFIIERWSAAEVAAHGARYRPADLPAFAAFQQGAPVGLVTYRFDGDSCEIVTIDARRLHRGVGSALLRTVESAARCAGCRRLQLSTTNDNLEALRFYQRRGFRLVGLYPGAVDQSRGLKPALPVVGRFGIPMHDEIELEKSLVSAAGDTNAVDG